MSRTETIKRIVDMLEKIASTEHLDRIYRFVKYIYIHREDSV